jgi:hypothetical protein
MFWRAKPARATTWLPSFPVRPAVRVLDALFAPVEDVVVCPDVTCPVALPCRARTFVHSRDWRWLPVRLPTPARDVLLVL